MKRQLSLSILLCLFAASVFAQTAEEDFYDALFFYEQEEDYQEALFLFKKILRDEPGNANAKYYIGMCYNNIRGEEHQGIPYFISGAVIIAIGATLLARFIKHYPVVDADANAGGEGDLI